MLYQLSYRLLGVNGCGVAVIRARKSQVSMGTFAL